ncbi:LuxR C-terminal-related transcriptional regulator [Sandarakinorhabdus sp. DWP1-3-1]|uniref:LuxR C-terminal-related transcriptional regulator n=1 Tax=Sandarakinorhabdus sp. DWP1-3-1 TaxID=2804627 RepID=UPI003CE93774
MTDALQVAIVARSAIVREGLDNILGAMAFVVVAKAVDGQALLDQLGDRPPPALVLFDSGPAEDAIAECRLLRQALAATQLVLMADDCRVDAIARAFAAGINGYLAKGIAGESLASALRLVSSGEHVIPSAAVAALTATNFATAFRRAAGQPGEPLSERESAILRCVARGDPNKLISETLGITETTVKGHIKAILRKLAVLNRTQAAMWAIINGLAPAELPPVPGQTGRSAGSRPRS